MSRTSLISLLVALFFPHVTLGTDDVSFSRDIRPILAKNCFQCHGPDQSAREADLRLDRFEDATRERDGYRAVAPNDADSSVLLDRVLSSDDELRMPPTSSGKQLTPEQISLLRQWIDQGAQYELHWSLRPIEPVAPPNIEKDLWSTTPIDRFVAQRLAENNLSPSSQADRYTLVRRLYLDIVGLLPSPEEVDRFIQDPSPNAYDQLVDRLLASPHFGERWGRYWLDQARYADSHGYTNDDPRIMWPYRDWVIHAFNNDMPFDQFTIEQLAGDLIPDHSQSQLIATGFHRNTLINTEGGVKSDQFRDEQVKDRVDTTGLVWMALTIGCAKCHTHKYDPIEQSEYYQLYAFFNSTADENSIKPVVRRIDPDSNKRIEELETQVSELKTEITKIEEATVNLPPGHQAKKDELKQLEASYQELDRRFPAAMIFRELKHRRPTHVQKRGDFLQTSIEVRANTPNALPPIDTARSPNSPDQLNRLDLARWLVRPDHPLTARVRVNRMWMRLFGTGLVKTENDFGTQGSLPTHPELLDWLAGDFQRDWSTKRILRLMVTSAVYKQSSRVSETSLQNDPLNQWLSRQSRLRVGGEIVRDCCLSASGMLTRTVGGPSVYPPQSDGVYAFTQHQREWLTAVGADRFRRGMYTFFYRSAPHPMLTTFDVPKFNQTCTCRDRSNTPLQSLTLANDEAVFELAKGLARRVLIELPSADDTLRLVRLFRVGLVRNPTTIEIDKLRNYLIAERRRLDSEANLESVAWTSVARVIMNLDEFITRE